MIATPTDDELLRAMEEITRLSWDGPDAHREFVASQARRIIDAPSMDEAGEHARYLLLEWAPFARALRRRFPQPITDEVLRAAGFEPGLQPGRDWVQKCGQTMLVARRPEGSLTKVLDRRGVEPDAVRKRVEELVRSGPDMVTMGKLLLTPQAKKVIEYAMEEARNLNHTYVGTEHLLLGLLREDEVVAHAVLREFGLRLETTRLEIHRLLSGDEKKAAEPPKEEAAAIDYNVPPLAAVTGVVRLRNEEELPVRYGTDGALTDASGGPPRWWYPSGSYYSKGHHLEDIVAQVSVGPTGPGVYALDGDGRVHLTGKDDRGWRVHAKDPWYRDEFGRCFDSHGSRYATGDLRRRIGDLPEAVGFAGTNRHDQWICAGCGEIGPGIDGAWRWTSSAWEHACEGRDPQAGHSECELLENVLRSGKDPLPAEVQEHVAAVEKAGEAAKAAEQYRDACERLLGVARRAILSDGRDAVVFTEGDLPPLLVALAAAAGKRDEPEPVAASDPVPAASSYTAEDAMAALYRPWAATEAREVLLIDVRRAMRGRMKLGLDPDHHLPHVEAGLSLLVESRWGDTSIDREHLRLLFDKAACLVWLDYEHDERNCPSESEYLALRAAADVLGETLPGWILEHAKKKGWA